MRVLVVYGTREGQTKKIAEFIADQLKADRHQVHVVDARSEGADPTRYDSVIVGAPVHIQQVPSEVRNWVERHSKQLSTIPSAFFSVCLGILERDPKTRAAEEKIVTDFFASVSWRARHWTIFPGALMYSKYGWFKRQMMRIMAKRAGGETDTSRDYEYTNWNEVRRFAREFSERLNAPSRKEEQPQL